MPVYTGTGNNMSGTVYDGISRHMTVYALSVKVHTIYTSIYWYMLVHLSTYLFSCSVPCCTRLARLKAADRLLPKDTRFKQQQVYSFTPFFGFCGPWRSRLSRVATRGWGWRRRCRCRRRRRRRRRQAVASDEDLDGDVVGGEKLQLKVVPEHPPS